MKFVFSAFNTDAIVYDNSPWRPGRDMDFVDHPVSEEDERKLKNLATRIMSNGVEVLVKDKNSDSGKLEQVINDYIFDIAQNAHHLIETVFVSSENA